MNRSTILVLLLILSVREIASGQDKAPDSFRWGNVTYLQLSVGQNTEFEGNEIELLEIKNHYNHIRINRDTFWVKFCYRCPAMETGKLKFFVAGSRNVKALTTDSGLHHLLKKDILLAVAPGGQPLLDPLHYLFPITFAGGYIWRNDEDSYPFSFQGGGSPRVVEDLQSRASDWMCPMAGDRSGFP